MIHNYMKGNKIISIPICELVPHRNVCDTAKQPTGALRHSNKQLDILRISLEAHPWKEHHNDHTKGQSAACPISPSHDGQLIEVLIEWRWIYE